MNRKKLAIALIGAGLLAGAAVVPAVAHVTTSTKGPSAHGGMTGSMMGGMAGHHAQGMKSGGMMGGGMMQKHAAMMEERMTAMDADKDGKLSQAEIFAYRQSRFTELDTDKDGNLSAEELDAAGQERRLDGLSRRLAFMDTDGDGKVGMDDFARHRGKHMQRMSRHGAVGEDGSIDMERMRDVMQQMMQRHSGHGSSGGGHGKSGHHN